ncbi:MAG: hypothetical protein KBT35_08570 [Firmicutes bacterium]|nr:hypothetical protein [Candidatus Colivicinus equi]
MKTFRNDLSEHDLKSISILQKTCDVDLENRIVEVPLHIDNIKEIADNPISNETSLSMGSGFINGIKTKISNIPHSFSVNFKISIKSTNNYTYPQIMDAIQEKMEEQYNQSSERKKNVCYKVIVYVIVCVIFSLLKTMPVNFDYTAGVRDTYSDIVSILINSIASLFLCQATWTIFDLVVTRRKEDGVLFKRINSIILSDGKNEKYSRSKEELFKYWPYQKNIEKICFAIMLLGSGYVMTICVVEIILFLTSRISLNEVDTYLFVFQWIFILFIIQVNTAFYFDRGELSKHALKISITYFIILTIYNSARLIIENLNSIPFDYDHFLFTYQMLSLVNIVCVYIINKERTNRYKYLEKLLSKENDQLN